MEPVLAIAKQLAQIAKGVQDTHFLAEAIEDPSLLSSTNSNLLSDLPPAAIDMDMGGDSMGFAALSDAGMNMTNSTVAMGFLTELLDDSDFQPVDIAMSCAFWYGIVLVIGIAAMINLACMATSKSRLRAAASKQSKPASPANVVTKAMATAMAIAREVTYPQLTPARIPSLYKVPPTGTVLLLLTYLGFILGLEYYNNVVTGSQHYEALGLRAAWLTVAQLPLLILLAGKNNLVGLVTGVSYERLHVFHRWVARTIWLTATLHWGYQQYGWSMYPGLDSMEKATDFCYPTGIAAWTILTWINVSSVAPLRNWSYEFFVLQHIITFVGFIAAIMIHIPVMYARVYVYIPIGLYIFDRLVRGLRYAYNNSRLGRATITALPGDVSKIQVRSSRVKNWRPGQHVFLSLPHFGAIQSHPATILSTPTSHSNDLVFILKAHGGFTARLHSSATSSEASLLPSSREEAQVSTSSSDSESGSTLQEKFIALIDGPYGSSHSDFAAFDTALLIAGSTGVTFTLAILLDIAERARIVKLPLRRLSFVWIVKSSSWTKWIAGELRGVVENMKTGGVELEVNIFVTCDKTLTDANTTTTTNQGPFTTEKSPGCKCTNTEGPCCCFAEVLPTPPTDSKAISGGKEGATSLASSSSSIPEISDPIVFPTEKKCAKSLVSGASSLSNKSIPAETKCSKSTSSSSSPLSGSKCAASPFTLQSGRPALETMIWDLLDTAEGETGIAVCGPLGLSARCRNGVAKISDERAVHKGSGAEGVYLHVEGFGW
ncbi:hypothetical protein MMC08_002940 [Hypocenomyce scalaris]|nr:hypothetical protein [Hypocenomyce scalaris]